jgi:hypothetical protein
METYYIAPLTTCLLNKEVFMEWHFVYTDEKFMGSEIVFVCARFNHKETKWRWEQMAGVEPLPHPFDPNGYLSARHADILKHHGVTTEHRTIEAADRASRVHALMKFGGI